MSRHRHFGDKAAAATLPKYVEELRRFCLNHDIPCQIDTERRAAALTLPSGATATRTP